MKEYVMKQSVRQGLKESKLPKFTSEEIKKLKRSSDYFALNHYSAYLAKYQKNDTNIEALETDTQTITWTDPKWPASTVFPLLTVSPNKFSQFP